MRSLGSLLPKHEAGLSLQHNEHRSYYDSIEKWEAAANHGDADPVDFGWVSVEQRQKAIETDSVWELRWYPRTPVGFIRLIACDLDVLLDAAAKVEGGGESQETDGG